MRTAILAATLILAGCVRAPSAPAETPSNPEADVSCYWAAERDATQPDVRNALSDGILSQDECRTVVMPYVDRSLADARAQARQRAVEASRRP